ncbi:hypothetical protein AOL_s00215g877 [Orbilia oligospora ATCC 24927]|uniref:Uncharacterized protein n=2 Tax=Orbilia oligospora TaxID=2813651 RepID=G1XV69_ARTOA|nr:hypothetical protein AOL_s00215g877 [Orbilia oligospora ATCC 24927]EGX42928.1 hypothetical protein AOL_s00215g877 [Orbilia oligospora ATCC 24927]KAF3273886.1 hypothetical protein TWF970_008296 [Orbilia oligospora]
MVFDGPYPTYSGSMERVINDALSSPSHEDVDDILSTSTSIHRTSFKFPRYIRTWLFSRPILRRLRSFGIQQENGSVDSSSSISIQSVAGDDILDRLPEGGASIGKLVQSIQNMDKCRTPLEASDTATEITCISPCGSLMSSPGGEGVQNIQMTSEMSPSGVRGLSVGMEIYSRTGEREKKRMILKKRYLEIHDGIWDSAVGTFIPNAWPLPGSGVKTAISRPKVSRKGKG